MRRGFLRFQIGKNGVTAGFIDSLNTAFKKNKSLRVSVLKSAARDREKIKEIAEEIIGKLTGSFACRIIGFTIVLRKVSVVRKK